MASLASWALRAKYIHHSAALPRKATTKAATATAEVSIAPKVVPVTRMDSPRAIMMMSWQRSAKCVPSIVHSSVRERPSPGVQYRATGPE
jgi:hypothetical protein